VDKFTGDGDHGAVRGAGRDTRTTRSAGGHAALHLQRELAGFAADVHAEHGVGFRRRTGLNSGEVVVGAIGEDLAMA
jgi:adenylate cyclase